MPNPKEQRKRGSIQSIDRATAILKALASGPRRLGVSELADRLQRLTKQTLNESELQRELTVIRDSGFATEREEAVLGESSAAAPIFDHGGHAVGAIGVVDSTDRIFPRGLARGLSSALGEAA